MKILNLAVMSFFALVLSYFLPLFADKVLTQNALSVRVRYSPVIDEFMLSSFDKQTQEKRFQIIGGKDISEDEFIQNQPFTYASVLIPKGLFADKFKHFTLRQISQNSQNLNLRTISNKIKPIPLYAVLDTDEKFNKVIFAPLLFRLGDENGVQIVDVNKNSVDEKISSDLNDKFKVAGFKFPAKGHFSNPTVMKEFDEGAFVVDSAGALFHVKFKDGNFSVKNTNLIKQDIVNIIVSENPRREFYALLVGKNELGLISYDDYKFIALANDGYDPFKAVLNLRIAPTFKSVMFLDDSQIKMDVMDLNYTTYKQNLTKLSPPVSLRYIKEYIFVFETSIVQDSFYLELKFSKFNAKSLFLSVLLAFAFFMYRLRFYGQKSVYQSAFIAIFGIYGLLATLFYTKVKI